MDNADKLKNNSNNFVPSDHADMEYFGSSRIIKDEQQYILKRQQLSESTEEEKNEYLNNKVAGLALSGGGIRSASFCLGVLQALSYNRWLKKFDYLSTVSGGGYIGSSLTWLLSRKWNNIDVGVGRDNFPYGTYPMIGQEPAAVIKEKVQTENVDSSKRYRGALLRYLRQHGKYLTPGRGINIMSLIGVVLRGSILSVFVYFSLLVLLFFVVGKTFLFKEMTIDTGSLLSTNLVPSLPNYSFAIALLLFGLFIVLAFLYSLLAYVLSQRHVEKNSYGEQQQSIENLSYKLRRISERSYNYILTMAVVFVVVGLVPEIYDQFDKKMQSTSDSAGLTGLISTIAGFFTSVMTFLKTSHIKPSKIPLGLLVGVSALTLWFGLLLLAYHCMLLIGDNIAAIWSLGIVTIIIGVFANLNYISIHRYYRDRLMEVFMPDLERIVGLKKSLFKGASVEADKARLSSMCWYQTTMANPKSEQANTNSMPYHIINSNIVLVSSGIAKFRGRGGDNFILTPAYCGSNATGWSTTPSFMKDRMTLSSAMAISGAAVNPSTGVGGDGVTRQPFLSMLMGLLNIRLGYWVTNPNPKKKPWLTNIPNYFVPGLSEMILRQNLNENSRYLQLSDGGHFENLGIYELVRRKTKLIIACDSAADPDYKFTDLSNVLEKIRADFGVLMTVNAQQLHELVPVKEKDNDLMAYAKQGFIMADILYPGRKPGKFIYIKSSFFKELSADLYGYKQKQPEFPDEPTSDQFFDEKQFEAYRELGYQTAWAMMKNDKIIDDPIVNSIFND